MGNYDGQACPAIVFIHLLFGHQQSQLHRIPAHDGCLWVLFRVEHLYRTEAHLCPFGLLRCHFFRGRRQGRQPLNPARGGIAEGVSLLSVGERGRAPCRRPTPPTAYHQKPPRFTVFCALPIFCHFSALVVSDGSTSANIGLKMGQHRPQDGPTWPQDGPT